MWFFLSFNYDMSALSCLDFLDLRYAIFASLNKSLWAIFSLLFIKFKLGFFRQNLQTEKFWGQIDHYIFSYSVAHQSRQKVAQTYNHQHYLDNRIQNSNYSAVYKNLFLYCLLLFFLYCWFISIKSLLNSS